MNQSTVLQEPEHGSPRTGARFSTCSELTPRAPIPDGRMERFMHPCSTLLQCSNDIGFQRKKGRGMSGVLHRTLGKENPRARVGLLRGMISTYQWSSLICCNNHHHNDPITAPMTINLNQFTLITKHSIKIAKFTNRHRDHRSWQYPHIRYVQQSGWGGQGRQRSVAASIFSVLYLCWYICTNLWLW